MNTEQLYRNNLEVLKGLGGLTQATSRQLIRVSGDKLISPPKTEEEIMAQQSMVSDCLETSLRKEFGV